MMRNASAAVAAGRELKRRLGLFDSTMIVAGSMIGSGIFLVTGEMSRVVGGAQWLMVSWAIATLLTLAAALSYGELAAMMPSAGGQYVYLREAFSPVWGFLYGWTLFLVIQTGTVDAVSIGFARYLGLLWPAVAEGRYVVAPVAIGSRYAVSLSTAQAIALLLIVALTWTNTRGIDAGKWIQNVFTSAKIGTLLCVVGAGIFIGWNAATVHANFGGLWMAPGQADIVPGIAPASAYGVLVSLCLAQVGALFAADAWNNITFTAGEVRDPKRNVPLSLAIGAGMVMALYIAANVAYLVVLPFERVRHVPSDRVASAMMDAILPGTGSALIAAAILISAFGCVNGMLLSGARAYFAMARDGLFLKSAGQLNRNSVPGRALVMQGAWGCALVLIRTHDPATGTYGNLYSNLLDYVISAALIFYILTIAGLFRLRATRPEAERPYRAFGYPVVPALYLAGAATILTMLFLYRPATTFPGVAIVMLGLPVYYWLKRRA
jgi:APA family basic amino acid/polyamine antiporter